MKKYRLPRKLKKKLYGTRKKKTYEQITNFICDKNWLDDLKSIRNE